MTDVESIFNEPTSSFPYCVQMVWGSNPDRYVWVNANFDPRDGKWKLEANCYCFEEEKDRTAFLLRWG